MVNLGTTDNINFIVKPITWNISMEKFVSAKPRRMHPDFTSTLCMLDTIRIIFLLVRYVTFRVSFLEWKKVAQGSRMKSRSFPGETLKNRIFLWHFLKSQIIAKILHFFQICRHHVLIFFSKIYSE